MPSREKAPSMSSGLFLARVCRETGRELHPAGLTEWGSAQLVFHGRRENLLYDVSLFQPGIISLRALGFGLGGLAADGPIALLDLFDGDPSQVAHALALDFDHRLSDLLDHVCFLLVGEHALDYLYCGEWHDAFASFRELVDRVTPEGLWTLSLWSSLFDLMIGIIS